MILGCGSPDPHSESTMYALLHYLSTHEICHPLDLVSSYHLGGENKEHNPNIPSSEGTLMKGGVELQKFFNNPKPRTWRPLNVEYMNFVLPKPSTPNP